MKSPEKVPLPARESENEKTTVHVVRHGPASYQIEGFQGDPNDADDLNMLHDEAFVAASEEERRVGKEQAVEIVRKTAQELAGSIDPEEEVVIWSSPVARAQETASIIREVFEENGLTIRKSGSASHDGIKIFETFGEVDNYNDLYFNTLVDGGELTIDGQTINIDPAVTNPKGLVGTQYFIQSGLDDIPEEVKATWPEQLVEFVDTMERYDHASGRIWKPVNRLNSVSDKKRRVIIVTHAGLADILVRSVEPDTEKIIDPADYVTLEQSDESMKVTRPGSLKDNSHE